MDMDKAVSDKLNEVYKRLNEVMKNIGDQVKGELVNDQLLYNVRTMLMNSLHDLLKDELKDFDVDVYSKDKVIRIKPKNLFTGLLLAGYYVAPKDLEGKTSYETDKFILTVQEQGIDLQPKNMIQSNTEEKKDGN